MLQNQTDRLFSALEKRTRAHKSEQLGGGVTFEIDSDDRRGFKIHVVGDSTMRVRELLFSIAEFATKVADPRVWASVLVLGCFANQVDQTCTRRQIGLSRCLLPSKKLTYHS